jgi:hypothetical protein
VALRPDGPAPRIVNLPEWARHVLERLDQALERGPDDRLAALRAELGSYLPPAAVGGTTWTSPCRCGCGPAEASCSSSPP